jgi:hypothetical protein
LALQLGFGSLLVQMKLMITAATSRSCVDSLLAPGLGTSEQLFSFLDSQRAIMCSFSYQFPNYKCPALSPILRERIEEVFLNCT